MYLVTTFDLKRETISSQAESVKRNHKMVLEGSR